ncbi:MAG: hypothetical protein K2Q12_09375 [Rickettsiales bacterium]|nr:hypothetical protein [Rickettsiales bacterium]
MSSRTPLLTKPVLTLMLLTLAVVTFVHIRYNEQHTVMASTQPLPTLQSIKTLAEKKNALPKRQFSVLELLQSDGEKIVDPASPVPDTINDAGEMQHTPTENPANESASEPIDEPVSPPVSEPVSEPDTAPVEAPIIPPSGS